MEMTPPFLITLGPLLYYWPRHTVQAFYREVAASAVDVVYLGETVCLRRHVLRPADWLEIAAELAAAARCFGEAVCALAVVELPDAGHLVNAQKQAVGSGSMPHRAGEPVRVADAQLIKKAGRHVVL